MNAPGAEGRGNAGGSGRVLSNVSRPVAVRALVIAGLFAFAFTVLPMLLGAYWIKILTATAIFAIVALGLNVLFGRVGLVSLGQIALLSIAAWIGARFFFLTGLPFPVVLLMTGVLTGVVGTLVGLPALRLSGLYLALITLMFAGLVTIVLPTTDFPNGGPGFLGHTDSSSGNPSVRRPSIAEGDDAFYRYTLVVMALMFLLALGHVSSKAGRAWAAIRQSEPAALAGGINITFYKLWAFALASFLTGVAGALLAANEGKIYHQQFRTIDSITLMAVVLMGGIFSLWGAVVAGLLQNLLPALLNDWFDFFRTNPDFLLVLFGIGVLQVLVTAPEGLVNQVPKDLRNLGRLISGGVRRLAGAMGRGP